MGNMFQPHICSPPPVPSCLGSETFHRAFRRLRFDLWVWFGRDFLENTRLTWTFPGKSKSNWNRCPERHPAFDPTTSQGRVDICGFSPKVLRVEPAAAACSAAHTQANTSVAVPNFLWSLAVSHPQTPGTQRSNAALMFAPSLTASAE